jgi:hypothetical protein
MLRRDFVRAMVSVGLAPRLLSQQTTSPAPPLPAPVPWTLGLNPETPLPQTEVADGIATTEQRFFSAVQMATLVRLSDVLLPPIGEKPGALQAGTPLFLDFLIGASPDATKKAYTGGLNWLESQSQKNYSKSFATLTDDEAGAILKPLLRTWMNDHPPTEPHADFVNIAHDDIRTATVNSKAWNDASSVDASSPSEAPLFWYPIEPDIYGGLAGSRRTPVHAIPATRAGKTIPAYPR